MLLDMLKRNGDAEPRRWCWTTMTRLSRISSSEWWDAYALLIAFSDSIGAH